MRKRVIWGLLLVGVSVALCGAQSRRHEGAEATIRKSAEEWAKHWNAKDLDKLTALYAPDAVVMPPNHEAVRGRAAILEFFKGVLASGVTDIIHEATVVKASGNQGYVLGRYSLSVPQKDGSTKQDRGKFLHIWERQPGGKWRITVGAFSSDLPG